ncbi:glycoprotein-N-acetylgalactosamine 3-beta-galactosyltransferase 1-like isoform X2 [Diachasmimorpha longicaudata]|uniref:glycoprotein-N-acetylgalactosamine 3-beta-galactosyltransferase 1-like isoform X2 n=1 Tax=Diachasmimorpha longicaudata TaxID=58733 RepID=UPI0030B87B39
MQHWHCLITRACGGRRFIFILACMIMFAFLSACLLSSFSRNSTINRLPVNYSVHQYAQHYSKAEPADLTDAVKKIRILCWIMTGPKTHKTKAIHVKATWGNRCNILLFMSSAKDDSLPTVVLPVGEGRNNLWPKTKEAFKYIYKNYKDKADWFMKADDDTYVIVENLRFMLSSYNTSAPLYFGYRFKPFVKQGYMSGGSGYVLSRESLRKFVQEALPNPTKCFNGSNRPEDVEIGKCLEKVGVKAMDSRDPLDRERFLPLPLGTLLVPQALSKDSWFWKWMYYEDQNNHNCCSDYAISFHYIQPQMMHVFDYLIYHVRPYGATHHMDSLRLTPSTTTEP